MPKMTLLEMVQNILSDMDSEEVNSIGETSESSQVASIIRDTYYNITTNRNFPELRKLIKLVPASDTDFPTHFTYGDEVQEITTFWYDISDDETDPNYQELTYLTPEEFLRRSAGNNPYVLVEDKGSGTKLKIGTGKRPQYYTSFDDNNIVVDSYDSSVDTTLQQTKTRAFGTIVADFHITDTFVPSLDANIFPLLLAESKSVAMSLLLGGADPKIDQAARRQRYRNQGNRYKTKQGQGYSTYGRH